MYLAEGERGRNLVSHFQGKRKAAEATERFCRKRRRIIPNSGPSEIANRNAVCPSGFVAFMSAYLEYGQEGSFPVEYLLSK